MSSNGLTSMNFIMKNRVNTIFLLASFILFGVAVFYFNYSEYHIHKTTFYKQVDEKLRLSALATDIVLSPEFHDRAVDASSITLNEYNLNMDHLSKLANKLNIIYLYTMVQKDGKIYFTASNATDEERRTGVNLTHYFDHYDDASEILKKVFETHQTSYDEYTDKWGTFRSVFIPMKSPNGNTYVIAADIRTDVIKQQLNNEMFDLLMRLLGTILLCLPFLTWYFRQINHKLKEEHIAEKKRSEEHIHYLSNFDLLTQLPNKAQLETNFKYLLSLAQRSHIPLAVLFLDLDHFKNINDSLGHKIGDEILVETAKRLKSLMRESDIVTRFSADEFLLVLSITDVHDVEKVAQKILNTINKPYHLNSYELNVTASIGIALYPADGLDIETLSKNADTAMSRAKQEGRNSYRFVTEEMQMKSMRYLQLSNALRNAMKNNELHVVYQPQISLHNGTIIGAEALLRWNNPELGAISPAEFIPIAEKNGLILPIGEWVLHTAISQASIWKNNHQISMTMAINLSAVQFRHPHLIDRVIQILDEVGLPPECLELELTESMAMENPDAAIKIMNTFFAHGIQMSIDDFGTGYSSLSYLKQFKISKLKIDQSFVRHICVNADDKAITNAIIHLAHSLGLQTIAEGVETEEQLTFLRKQGCDEIQGYYYSKPCSVDEFEAFAASHRLTNLDLIK